MGQRREAIVCRQCETVFPLAERNCPECGTPVRSRLGLAAVVATGIAVFVVSRTSLDALFALLGVIIVGIGIAGFRDRRRRIRQARERRGRSSSRSAE